MLAQWSKIQVQPIYDLFGNVHADYLMASEPEKTWQDISHNVSLYMKITFADSIHVNSWNQILIYPSLLPIFQIRCTIPNHCVLASLLHENVTY